MTFYIVTLGCKVNTYESEVIKEKLLSHHFKLAASELESDIIIINTCSVTNMADNKSKKWYVVQRDLIKWWLFVDVVVKIWKKIIKKWVLMF